MKRLLLFIVALVPCMLCQADDYDTFTFAKTDGTEVALPAIGLRITYANGKMTAVNGSQTATLSLADLSAMRFSTAAAGIAGVTADNGVKVLGNQIMVAAPQGTIVQVVNLLGQTLCRQTASGSSEAVGGVLMGGVYLVKVGQQTIKVLVR